MAEISTAGVPEPGGDFGIWDVKNNNKVLELIAGHNDHDGKIDANTAAIAGLAEGVIPDLTDAGMRAVLDSGGEFAEGVTDQIDEQAPAAAADAAGNPETALNSAIVDIVGQVLGGGAPDLVTVVDARLSPGTARPAGWLGKVQWLVNSGDPRPINWAAGDFVYAVSAIPLPPATIFADTFTRPDGALGNTSTGTLPWSVGASTDGNFGIVGGRAAVIAGTGGYACAFVDGGLARTRLSGTLAVNGADAVGGFAFRWVDVSNHYLLYRVSAAAHNYRLVKRVAGVATNIKTTTHPIVNGDRVMIDDRVAGELKIYVNGTKIYDQLIDTTVSANDFLTATKSGIYASTTTGTARDVRWDDVISEKVA